MEGSANSAAAARVASGSATAGASATSSRNPTSTSSAREPLSTAAARVRSPSSSRRATHCGFGNDGNASWIAPDNRRVASLSAGDRPPTRRGRQRYEPVATSATTRFSSSSPSPERAAVATTGTPRSRARRRASTVSPLRRASSIRLRQTTARSVISSTWSARFRFRSRRVASTTITVTSGRPKRMKSRAVSSSRLDESSE